MSPTWKGIARRIDRAPAELTCIGYGIARALDGREVWVGCNPDGQLQMAKLTFRDAVIADFVYGGGFRIEIKVTRDPEHPTRKR